MFSIERMLVAPIEAPFSALSFLISCSVCILSLKVMYLV